MLRPTGPTDSTGPTFLCLFRISIFISHPPNGRKKVYFGVLVSHTSGITLYFVCLNFLHSHYPLLDLIDIFLVALAFLWHLIFCWAMPQCVATAQGGSAHVRSRFVLASAEGSCLNHWCCTAGTLCSVGLESSVINGKGFSRWHCSYISLILSNTD